jgi:glycosyltransferase involved in cell wall biosynthesis
MSEPIAFLLPRFDPGSPEHFFHLYGFLERVAKELDLTVVIERMPRDAAWRGTARAHRLRSQSAGLRFVEELLWFASARLRGIRRFYIHYSLSGGLAASLVTRLFGGETYYWNCGMYRMFAPGGGSSRRERMNAARGVWLLERVLHLCTFLVTGTPRMAEYYAREARLSPGKIRVLPNFIDGKRFGDISRREARERLGIGSDERVLLFLHRVAPRKGAHFLPDILRAVSERAGPVRLVVAGDGPYFAPLRETMARAGLAGRCDFRGWVPNREAPLYFRAADVYLMPSLEEGFPRVLLEAMASGCPFVAFDVGGVMDVVTRDQAEQVAPAEAVDSFAQRVVGLLLEPRRREGMAAAGLTRVAAFDEARIAPMFVEMMRGAAPRWPGADGEGSAL